jgi:hypothetical protein
MATVSQRSPRERDWRAYTAELASNISAAIAAAILTDSDEWHDTLLYAIGTVCERTIERATA